MRMSPAEWILDRRIAGGNVCRTPRPVVNKTRIVPLRRRSVRRCDATEAGDTSVQTAEEAVNEGLAALEKRSSPGEAIELFRRALEMNPTAQEASAAAYNIACCYVEMKEWQKAADQIVVAVNDYRLDIKIPNQAGLIEKREIAVDVTCDGTGHRSRSASISA